MKNLDKNIDGKSYANKLLKKIFPLSEDYFNKFNRKPSLAVILIGEDPASNVYVKNKIRTAEANNIESIEIKLPTETSEEDLLQKIISLNEDAEIDGILVQLPLPTHISEQKVINTINPDKDVDGFHPVNFGKLYMGIPNFIPCTPLGCLYMIKNELKDIGGKNAVIVGRSNIVGKPMASLLLSSNCTVTLAHSKTKQLKEHCKNADILIAAIGRPEMIDNTYVNENAIVIDVGINRVARPLEKKKSILVGDINYKKVYSLVKKITPVPGGVGPMTIACLMHNTIKAAYKNKNHNFIDIFEETI
jgi:methylenetetrahydrofolate dehydrogenase (NADP+)/methenyltetrahydrofolate cyclohydrolase